MAKMTRWYTIDRDGIRTVQVDDPSEELIGAPVPDWVRLPPELGSDKVRVIGSKGSPPKRELVLENGMKVAHCPTHGFVWSILAESERGARAK